MPTFPCSNCGQLIDADVSHAGKTIACPTCKNRMVVSDAGASTKAGILDRFMGLMFRFGKGFAGILAIVFLLGILVNLAVFVSNLGSSIEIPQYEEIVADYENSEGTGDSEGIGGLDERRQIEKRFGDDVADIVKEHSLGDEWYDQILAFIGKLEEDYRSDYIDGLEDVLSDAAKAREEKADSSPSVVEVMKLYSNAFLGAEGQAEQAKAGATIARQTALIAILLCCFMMFMMLVVPALLKIEENTRGVKN